MKLIVFDFLRRWCWLLIACAVFTALISLAQPFTLAPLTLILLMFDGQRGVLHVIRPQPVSRRDQEQSWWFISVWLMTLLSVPFMVGSVLLRQLIPASAHLPVIAPWFAAGLVLWIGLGLCALMFLLCVLLPTSPPQSRMEMAFATFISGLWGLMMPSTMMLMMRLPKTPAEMQTWHWVIAALVPVLVVVSRQVAPIMAQRRLRPVTHTRSAFPSAEQVREDHSGSTGLRLLLTTLIGRLLAFLLLMAGTMQVTFYLLSGGIADAFPRQAALQVLVFAIMIPAFLPDWFSLRMLRTMPISTRRLSLVLLSVPFALGMLIVPLTVIVGGLHTGTQSLGLYCFSVGLFSAGLGAATLTFMCHVTSGWRLIVFILPGAMMPFFILSKSDLHLWPLVIGAVLLAASFLLMQRGLRRSAAFYRARQNFGMNVGQPFGTP